MSQDCIFCKIIEGKIPSHKVWEDDNFLAILDIFPSSKGMTVVIPKVHLPSYIKEVDNKTLSLLFDAVKEVANILDTKLKDCIRTTFIIEGVEVDHLHVKLIPFYKKDLNKPVPEKASDKELLELAKYLRT